MKNHHSGANASPDPAFTAGLLAVRWTENLQNLRLRTGPQRLQGAWQLTTDRGSLVLHWSRRLPVAAHSSTRQFDA